MNDLTTTEKARPPAMASQALAVTLGRFVTALENRGRGSRPAEISSQRAPTQDERRALQARQFDLARSLIPASEKTIQGVVTMMRVAFPAQAMTADEKRITLKVYASALARFPEWAIEQAAQRFLDGSKGNTFCPTPPELAAECQNIVAMFHAEHAQIGEVLSAEVYREASDEEKARVQAGFDQLLKGIVTPPADRPTLTPKEDAA